MRKLRFIIPFVLTMLVLIPLSVNAQDAITSYRAIAKQRLQFLNEKLKLNKSQSERIYDIYLLSAENLFNELNKRQLSLDIDNVAKVMAEEIPYISNEIMSVLHRRQKRRYKADLKNFE